MGQWVYHVKQSSSHCRRPRPLLSIRVVAFYVVHPHKPFDARYDHLKVAV